MGSSFQVEVYDVKGQLIYQSKSNHGLEVVIDGAKYAAGVYYAKVTTATGSEIVRLIKKYTRVNPLESGTNKIVIR